MPIALKELEVGKVYAQGTDGNQIFCYFGKVRGRYNRWSDEIKEGHLFLYVGREHEFEGTGKWADRWTPPYLASRCASMLSFDLGEQISIVKRNKPMAYVYKPEVRLTPAEVEYLIRVHGLVRIR